MKSLSFIYILSNERNTVLYIGITSNLKQRVWKHKNNIIKGFTSEYNVHKLVYYEYFESIELAIKREKQLKGGSRLKKVKLINKLNPEWKDLYPLL